MSFVQELRNARSATSANVHNFLLQYKNQDKYLYLFFEGFDDEAFYMNHIQNLLPPNWFCRTYKCVNKDDIYRTHQNLKWNYYSKNKILFFADKDFSDFIPEIYPDDINIFVTEFYSIENYITTKYVLKRFIRELCHFTDDSRIDPLLNKFDLMQEKFYKKCLPLMAWIIVMKRQGKRPQLGDINFQKLFNLDENLNLTKKREFIDNAKAMADSNHSYSRNEIVGVIKDLQNCDDPKKYIRGKYDLWFFYKFAEKIPEILNKTKNAGEPKITAKVSLGEMSAMKVLAPRSTIPNSLETFLKERIREL